MNGKPRVQPQTKEHQSKPLIDIILPVYGEWALAQEAIKSIEVGTQGLSDKYRLIVVDNGTPAFTTNDGITITPEAQAKDLKELLRTQDAFVRLEDNRGFPGGVNEGVKRGKAPLVMILSSDIVLIEGAIAAMVREMDDPSVGMLGIKLLFPEPESKFGPPGTIQHAGHSINIAGQVTHIFIGWSRKHPKVNKRREMVSVTGAVFMTRRALWNKIGGLSEDYGKGTYEDIDYCFNVHAHGQKVVYTPYAEAYHMVGGSINHGAEKEGFNLSVNEQIFKGRWINQLAWDAWRYW